MEVIERNNIPSDFDGMMEKETHHDHKIIKDKHGMLRWEADPFVSRLIDSTNLNFVIQGFHEKGVTKNSEVYRELYRKMGYSLSGYWEIFYWEVNNEEAPLYKQPENTSFTSQFEHKK
jgi:hypothetical protein